MGDIGAELAYLFRHALVREAAYQLQPPADRAQLHLLALDILEDVLAAESDRLLRAHAAELAEHARAAREGAEPERQAELGLRELGHLRRAASWAAVSWRHGEVIRHARRVQQLSCATPQDHAIGESMQVSALMYMGKYVDAREAVRRAIELCSRAGDTIGRVRMMFNACLVARSLGEYEELGQRSAELLAEVSATDPSGEEHARALKVRSSYLLWLRDFEKSLECVNQAVAILEQLGSERELAGALIDRAALYGETGHTEERDHDMERAREIAVRLQDYFREALILVNKARFLLAEGKLKETLDTAQLAEQAARRAESANILGQARSMRALACQALGRESEAASLWMQTLELIQQDTPGPLTRGVLIRCADSHLRQGRREQASRLYQQACRLQHIVIEDEEVARLLTTLQSTFSR